MTGRTTHEDLLAYFMLPPRRDDRSALNQLNGGGGVLEAAQRLVLGEFAESLATFVKVIRHEARRAFADELVDQVEAQTFRVGHIDRADTIALIRKLAKREVE